jgi:SulP family sulfate permease
MKPSLVPFLAWPRPDRALLRADLVAGATVAVVAVPQALAYAQLAGMPPHVGLYAAFVPTIVAALFGASAQVSTGPVALTSLLTAGALAPLAAAGSAAYAALAVALAIGSGLVQLAAGYAGWGRWIERIPAALMLGFVNAAALVIALSQLPALLGVRVPSGTGPIGTLVALRDGLPAAVPTTAAFGLAGLAALLALRRAWPRFPGALAVSIAAILASAGWGYESIGPVVGDLPAGLPLPAWPAVDPALLPALLPGLLTIAVVSFIEVTSSARVIATRTGVAWNVNQELVGQGLAKVAAGVFGAFPVSGSFSRSALNLGAGARSPWSSLVCAALVGAALLFATGALHHLPTAVLAALIVSAVATLVTPRELIGLWRGGPGGRGEAAVAWTTLVATLLSAPRIHYGLLVGLAAVGVRAALARGARPG